MASLANRIPCLSSSPQTSLAWATNLSPARKIKRSFLTAGRRSTRHGPTTVVRCQAGGRGGSDGSKGSAPSLGGVAEMVTAAGQVIWGKGLPPGMLVQVARESWTIGWQVMMSQLAPTDQSGAYKRPPSAYRDVIEPSPPSGPAPQFPAEPRRYHLYAALSCPWAHRALIVHRLKGLDDALPVSICRPGAAGLWEFARPGEGAEGARGAESAWEGEGGDEGAGGARLQPTADGAGGCTVLKEVYGRQAGGYDGRCTVPMLWDTKTNRVVNNESADIIAIMNSAFDQWALRPDVDLAPAALQEDMARWDTEIYANVNNGVYRCGFARTQSAYLDAVSALFATLDRLDAHLASQRYLCGPTITLSDVRLFTTLVRFDAAYHPLFKCSRRKLVEYPSLNGFVKDVFQIPGVADTCAIEGVAENYFGQLFPLNPGGIVPVLPDSCSRAELMKPHNRQLL